MQSSELRKKFLEFFEQKGHKVVPSSSLLPTDPSVLFTTAGMQQFKQYYLGDESPYGKDVASCQKCIRTSDIEEVGDESHLTFFEMLGNFSFGGYWKKEAIELAYKFIAEELKLNIDYVTVFSPEIVEKGDWRKDVPEDTESFEIWKKFLPEEKIKKEGTDNFWGPTGKEGPCGPTTEIYARPVKNSEGSQREVSNGVKSIEVWNIVFNEFFCNERKKLEKLDIHGVDTGMGLERLAMVAQKKENIFETDLFESSIKLIPDGFEENKKRIIADHCRAIVFLISDGVKPSNKEQGYILRRLIRRVSTYEFLHKEKFLNGILQNIVSGYNETYKELDESSVVSGFSQERDKFIKTLENGISEYSKIEHLDTKKAFYLYQTFGLPYDIIKELDEEKSRGIREEDFEKELKAHQNLSRTASSGMFKGGLADEKPETVKLHTAHHLVLAALQEVLGKSVKQKGSNITGERLRIDFSFDRKLTEDEKLEIENIVNKKISEGLKIVKREMPKEEAEKIGAEMEFGIKYEDNVSVYFIEDEDGEVFSKEFCGGPHVSNTSELGKFKIIKEEAVGAGVRRIKAILE